jgi:ribosomal protein S18 acetylase RimI-like enzyme
MDGITIERVEGNSGSVAGELAALLMNAVENNAGISFMSDLTLDQAEGWWRKLLENSPPRMVVLVARDSEGAVGTVQLQPAWPPNQPHRADVAKLIVHTRARGRGIARMLMRELEEHARNEGFTLLLLDTCKDSAAEKLYTSLDWMRVGVVPNFALNPDGSMCDTVFFYKSLAPEL